MTKDEILAVIAANPGAEWVIPYRQVEAPHEMTFCIVSPDFCGWLFDMGHLNKSSTEAIRTVEITYEDGHEVLGVFEYPGIGSEFY